MELEDDQFIRRKTTAKYHIGKQLLIGEENTEVSKLNMTDIHKGYLFLTNGSFDL